jgi:hypothetical protein
MPLTVQIFVQLTVFSVSLHACMLYPNLSSSMEIMRRNVSTPHMQCDCHGAELHNLVLSGQHVLGNTPTKFHENLTSCLVDETRLQT